MIPLLRRRGASNPFVGILDHLSTAASGAYSFRQLRAAYAGGPFLARRSSDNATREAVFAANGNWNTADILGWSGSDSVYVTQWHDQSGNGRDFKQTTAGAQPRIINAGVVETKNGLPAAKLVSVTTAMLTDLFTAYTGTALSASAVMSLDSGGAATRRLLSATKGTSPDYDSTSRCVLFLRRIDAGAAMAGYRADNKGNVGTPYDTLTALYSDYPTGGPHAMYSQAGAGTTVASAAAFDINKYLIGYGADQVTSEAIGGTLAEVIVFEASLSSGDRATLLTDQTDHYGL